MPSVFSTIHIFGFGTVQLITKDKNIQLPKSDVIASVDAVIDEIWDKRPIDHTGQKEYHAINIFNGMFVDWQSKQKGVKGFRIKMSELDATLFEDLANEIDFVDLQRQNTRPTTTPTP
jgi:hypothetical protein